MNEPQLAQEVLSYYKRNHEADRLDRGVGRLELARTRELVRRFMTPPPAAVLDVGGAAGIHAFWLARDGYAVHLRDPVPDLVQQAREISSAAQQPRLVSAHVGDARALDLADASIDVVLMLGPLYHLVDRVDRLTALGEALRVLRPGGSLLAAAISRYASALDGMVHGYLADPDFVDIVERDLTDGRHRNTTGKLDYFTTAFFHRPDELGEEIEQAGFRHEATLPIEGPAWLLQDFDAQWLDERKRAALLDVIRSLEKAPSLLGASAHLLAVGRKTS